MSKRQHFTTCASLSIPNLNSPVQYFTLISRRVPTAQGAAITTVLHLITLCLQARTVHRLLCTGHWSPHPHPAVTLRCSLVGNILFCSSFWHLVYLLNFMWSCATLKDLEQRPVLNKMNYSLKLLQNSLSEITSPCGTICGMCLQTAIIGNNSSKANKTTAQKLTAVCWKTCCEQSCTIKQGTNYLFTLLHK